MKLPEDTIAFIENLPEININKDIVQDVRAEEFDELMAANEALLEDVKKTKAEADRVAAKATQDVMDAKAEADKCVAKAKAAAEKDIQTAKADADRRIAGQKRKLDEAYEKLNKALQEKHDEEAARTALLKDGDRVTIRTGSSYLNKVPSGTYCATTGTQERATFRVHKRYLDSGTGNGHVWGWSFEIDNMFTNDGYRFLYIATTGSAKYDSEAKNSKQLFVQDTSNNINVRLGTPTALLDVYTYSFLSDTSLSARPYSNGGGKYWVEGKKAQHTKLGHVSSTTWILERV
jgi:F0F1-type ATP synthase membrane subunit b/b'